MEKDTLSLEAALIDRLQTTIKTKQGNVAVDENGRPITAVQAIAMSILQNAMKGDIQSATFIRNLTRSIGETDEESARRIQQALDAAVQKIHSELQAEGLYLGQDIEIEQVAQNLLLIESLNRQMAAPDYEDLIQEYRRDGTMQMRINPLHEWRDRYQKQLLSDLKDLRTDAMRRKISQQQFNKKKS